MSEFAAKDRTDDETEAQKKRFHDEQPKASGSGTGSETSVREKTEAMADQARQRSSENLSSLAASVRRASDDYRKSQPGLLADLMAHAAEGVDSLARGVGGGSTSDLIGSARQLGRRNPVGLLLGGVAAGFAISRLAVGMSNAMGAEGRSTGTTSPANTGEGDRRHDT